MLESLDILLACSIWVGKELPALHGACGPSENGEVL